MNRRQTEGSETWKRLLDWDRGQKASERLAAQVLCLEGYTSVDPSHPLGGPDGLKDTVCLRGEEKWIGAVYFARGQQKLSKIRSKFEDDLGGVEKNEAKGIAFVTNQELRLADREQLNEVASRVQVDLFHLERVAMVLNRPMSYGIRLDFLDIEMNKEEQVAFNAVYVQSIDELRSTVAEMAAIINDPDLLKKMVQGFQEHQRHQQPTSIKPLPPDPLSLIVSGPGHPQDWVCKCSYCGYGYSVRGIKLDGLSLTGVMGMRPVIGKCPECGNVDIVEGLTRV